MACEKKARPENPRGGGSSPFKEHIRDLHLASIEGLREHYEQWRQPGDPPTLAEYLASEWPERQHRAAMNMLREIIDNIDVGPTINNMYWATVSGRTLEPATADVGPASVDAVWLGKRQCLHRVTGQPLCALRRGP